jgi:hypothetical protein
MVPNGLILFSHINPSFQGHMSLDFVLDLGDWCEVIAQQLSWFLNSYP